MEAVRIDRLAMRGRPEGAAIMHQNWDNLLFLHWPIDAGAIRHLIPQALELDTFDGVAWIGLTPFALNHLRLIALPEVPGLGSFLEVNVRTYVHYQGRPGIWFFSLDASKLIPTIAARIAFMLPYFKAEMTINERDGEFQFASRRSGPPSAEMRTHWRTGIRLRAPDPDSLAFFLVERYCLFAGSNENLRTTRVYHAPWILEEAHIRSHQSTMIASLGLPEPSAGPLSHFSRSMHVEIWPPAAV